MAQNDLLVAHLQDTTSMMGSLKKVEKSGITTLWVVGAIVLGTVLAFAQMRQRDKVDSLAVKEGKIPAITVSLK